MKTDPKTGLKKCPKCGREMDPGNFYRSSYTADGLRSYCKECTRSYKTANKKPSTDEQKELDRQRKRAKRAAALKGRKATCLVCGKEFSTRYQSGNKKLCSPICKAKRMYWYRHKDEM